MENIYLGETVVDITTSEYKNHTKLDWVLLWIEMYGGIDGAHHKDWLLDQCVRILKGTPVILKLARWERGITEERFDLDLPPAEYWEYIRYLKDGEDGPDTYGYSFGIAP